MITFQYPGYNPTVTLEVKNPAWGDNEAETNDLLVHLTQAGTFGSTIKKSDIINSSLDFAGIEKTKIQEVRNFFLQAQKHYILYTDYKGIQWMCLLVGDSFSSMKDPAGYSFSVELNRWRI